MADLSSLDRLQPALFDRLIDHDPEQKIESKDRRMLSMQRLRECVRRDLAELLNSGRLESLVDLDDYPEVAQSVLNYGIPDLSGMHLAGADAPTIERAVHKAILQFEPRLLKRSLKVTVETADRHMNRHAMVFRIEAEVWAEPSPIPVLLRTEFDLESGTVSVSEGQG